jgi:hypothetical protein
MKRFLTYKPGAIGMIRKKAKKRAIGESKAKPPEIFVQIENHGYYRSQYARAHIRVKADEYQYLEWRDGGRVRSLYLGRKRKS